MPRLSTECRFCPLGTREKRCERCNMCLRHNGCVCIVCPKCRATVPPRVTCKKCKACKAHHLDVKHIGLFHFRTCEYQGTGQQETYAKLGLHRNIGAELELSRLGGFAGDMPQCAKLAYHFEHDGSVTSGQELVTHHAQGDTLFDGLVALGDQLTSYACAADRTCGFHVHVDAADFTGLELRNIFVGFQLVGPQLYGSFVHPERQANQYCRPFEASPEDLHNLIHFTKNSQFTRFLYERLYGIPQDTTPKRAAQLLYELRRKKYVNDARRYALNFHSHTMRGTLEYRLKEGTVDPAEVLYWPIFCGFLTERLAQAEPKVLLAWQKEPPRLQDLVKGCKATGFAEWLKKKSSPQAWPQEPPARLLEENLRIVRTVTNRFTVAEPPFRIPVQNSTQATLSSSQLHSLVDGNYIHRHWRPDEQAPPAQRPGPEGPGLTAPGGAPEEPTR